VKAEAPKKRKAEEEVTAPVKKAKTDEAASADEYTTLFAGNLGWGITDDSLYEAFKDFEGIKGARVVTDKAMQRSRGFGYVEFETHENAKAAFEKMNGFELEGRALNLDPSKPRPAEGEAPNARANDRAKQFGDSVSPESDTLFVGNLPFEVDEDTISAFFSEVKEVKSLRLPKDPYVVHFLPCRSHTFTNYVSVSLVTPKVSVMLLSSPLKMRKLSSRLRMVPILARVAHLVPYV
jgi:nucleolin